MRKQFSIFLVIIFSTLFFIYSAFIVRSSENFNLVAHWDFNEGSGDIVRDIAGDHNGVRLGPSWRDGAMFFDGRFDYVTTDQSGHYGNTIPLPELTNLTIIIRVESATGNDLAPGDEETILGGNNFTLALDRDKNINFSGLGDNWTSTGVDIKEIGIRTYLALAFDGSILKIYKDGYLVKSLPALGKIGESTWNFGGDGIHNARIILDDIKIYANTLKDGEILNEYLYNQPCTEDIWECGEWSVCSANSIQTRNCSKILDCLIADTPSPSTSQPCTYTPPTCTSWTYSGWSSCQQNSAQTRIVINSYPTGCSGGNPVLTQDCVLPSCTLGSWSCDGWSACSQNDIQTRTCNKAQNCQGEIPSPATSQSCSYIPSCISSDWSCIDWGVCSYNNTQKRSCNKTSNCVGGATSPTTTQSCSYTPATPTCSADTWQCGNWGTCSPQGIQTRSCSRTYDCPSAETAAPATSQYCEAPNKPAQQTPTEDLGIVNQDSIIKATVKLICPVSSTMASQGSGTVIDSRGTILTNKHVIEGTPGCLVGFVNNYNDEPYFGDRQIADIYKISSDADIAILKLRNPNNKSITAIDITIGNSNNLRLGDQITTYGYPAKFGIKITYTSGDFSGNDGNYFKTTAIIDKGNSGGGAYLKNGAFIGIPSEVTPGYFNIMGKILSINKINSWLNNSPMAYNSGSSNSYSRVSILEDIDLNTLDSLNLFIAGDEKNIKTTTESQTVIAEEKKLATKIDNNLSKRMNGNILLQVEKNGEGWYVYPDDKKKYYLGRPADAFSIMRNLGLGIKHSELIKYLNSKFSSKLSGKILLDVEQNGEAYYVNPNDLKGYFLNRPADAFKVMRDLGLGITNADIRKIGVGEIK